MINHHKKDYYIADVRSLFVEGSPICKFFTVLKCYIADTEHDTITWHIKDYRYTETGPSYADAVC